MIPIEYRMHAVSAFPIHSAAVLSWLAGIPEIFETFSRLYSGFMTSSFSLSISLVRFLMNSLSSQPFFRISCIRPLKMATSEPERNAMYRSACLPVGVYLGSA